MKALKKTDFNFSGQKDVYHGKVRDVYNINDEHLVMVVTDRISAFDVVLPKGIPYKGQVLNQIATRFLDATADLVPNWKTGAPDPNVTVGHYAEPFKVEMVIRGYLTGHAWREYRDGKRTICGVSMPEGMKEHDKFLILFLRRQPKLIRDMTRIFHARRSSIRDSFLKRIILYSKIIPENCSDVVQRWLQIRD